MSEDDIERTLREAFAAQARRSVDDARPAPAPRFANEPTSVRRGRARLLAPLAAAAAVVAVVGGILTVARDTGSGDAGPVAGGGTSSHAPTTSPASPTTPQRGTAWSSGSEAPARSVHIRLFNADGAVYGVGMPVVAIFSARITDARPFVRATNVTVNDAPVTAAWYFEESAAGLGAMEAHLRPKAYWPAHAKVHVSIATEGVSAGRGMVYDDSLTLDFTTGARTIATVDDRSGQMTVHSDGNQVAKYPVSLGASKTPTMGGTKVIMEKTGKVKLTGPGYSEVVDNALRLTYSGEYVYGAPWKGNGANTHVDTTQGCTLLQPAAAARLFKVLQVGDPVEYVHTSGGVMPPGDGFGDWNVPWSKWVAGGLLPTR